MNSTPFAGGGFCLSVDGFWLIKIVVADGCGSMAISWNKASNEVGHDDWLFLSQTLSVACNAAWYIGPTVELFQN